MKKVKFPTDFRGFFPAKKSVRHVRHVRHAVEAAELAVRSSPVSGLRPGHLPTDRRESQSLEESMQCMAFKGWTQMIGLSMTLQIMHHWLITKNNFAAYAAVDRSGWRAPEKRDEGQGLRIKWRVFSSCKQLKELFWDSEIEEYDSMQHALVLFDFLFWIFNFETLNFRSELHSPENYFPHQNDDVTM